MTRLVVAFLAALVSWLGLAAPSSIAAVPSPTTAVGYVHEAPQRDSSATYIAAERSPPASTASRVPTYNAVGLRPQGLLVPSDSTIAVTYHYDATRRLVRSNNVIQMHVIGQTGPRSLPTSSGVAAKTADDFVGPLSKAEYDGLQKALEPNSLNHLFAKQQHVLDGLVERYGSQEAVVEQMYRGLSGAVTPNSEGLFSVTRSIGGQAVTIDGRVVNGIPRIGTAYIKP